MKDQAYLIFSFNHTLYGINTLYVEEIVPLPELTYLPETPDSVVGIFNLRGHRCLVIDLQLQIGDHPSNSRSQNYQLSDSVVVIQWEEAKVGIVANKVLEIKTILPTENTSPNALEIDSKSNLDPATETVFNDSLILTRSENILILSNPAGLIRSIEMQLSHTENYLERTLKESPSDSSQVNEPSFQDVNLIFSPSATSTERTIFQQRANDLGYSKNEQVPGNLMSLVVIKLGDHLFGIHSEFVQEFVDVIKITPVPCCPESIVGNMNLRGEILTLIDIRSLLKLPCNTMPEQCVAVVVNIENTMAGIIVEEVHDAMYLLNPRSVELVSNSNKRIDSKVSLEYLQGTATYNEQAMDILDLSKFLLKGNFLLHEIA